MRKEKIALSMLFSAVLLVIITGCSREAPFCINSISSYKYIPGITLEEIEAIEALKAARQSFSLGTMLTTEAFTLPDGTNAGFAFLLSELLTGLFDIPFVHEFHEWSSLKYGVDNATIDFTIELSPTPERREIYFMSYPIARRSLLALTYGYSVKINTQQDLYGLRLGFWQGTITAQAIRNFFPALEFEEVDILDSRDAVEKLRLGFIDAHIIDSVDALMFDGNPAIRANVFSPWVSTTTSLTTANPDLAPIISALDKFINAGGNRRLYELYYTGSRAYTRYILQKSLSDEERAYLAGLTKNIPIVLRSDLYPLNFFNSKDNEFQGITVDILAEISCLTGIEFEIINNPGDPFIDLLEMLKSGKASLITTLHYLKDRKDDFIWVQPSFLTSPYVFLSRTDLPGFDLFQLPQARVGAIKGTSFVPVYNQLFPGLRNLVFFATNDDALDALEKGGIDLFFTLDYVLYYQINYREKHRFKVNLILPAIVDSFIGLNRNEEELHSIISASISFVDTNSIVHGWMSRRFDYSTAMMRERFYFLAILSAGLLLMLVILVILLLKNSRKRKVILDQANILTVIYNSIPAMVFRKDRSGQYTGCNKKFEEFAKMTESEIIGKFPSDIGGFDEKLSQLHSRIDEKVFNEGKEISYEEWYTFPDKSRRPMEITKTPLFEDGKVTGLLGFSWDISAHKLAEEYRYADNLNRALAKIAESPAFSTGVLNDAAKIVAYEGSRALNIPRVGIWIITEDRKALKSVICYDTDAGGFIVQDDFNLANNNKYLYSLLSLRLITINEPGALSDLMEGFDPCLCAVLDAPIRVGGNLVGVICCEQKYSDAFPEKRLWTAEEQSFASSLADFMAIAFANDERRILTRRIESMMNNFPGVMFQSLCDPPNFTFTYLSQGCQELLGYTPEELTGSATIKFFDLVHPDDAETVVKINQDGLASNAPIEGSYRIITKDGKEKWIWERSHAAEFNPDGTPSLMEGFFTDITEQKRLEAAEQESYEKSLAFERTQLMLDSIPICCQLFDSSFKNIDCNQEAIRLFGFKDKKEFLERSHELYPEFQSDGQRSTDKIKMHLKKAAEEGISKFDWTYRLFDGTEMPAEATVVRVEYGDDFVLAGYTRDLREHKRMMEEIELQSKMLNAVNTVSAILLEPDLDKFSEKLLYAMGLLGKTIDVDRVYIWKNYAVNGDLYCTQLYEWSGVEKSQQGSEYTVGIPYSKHMPGWIERFAEAKCINTLVRDMSAEEQAIFAPQGVVSLLIVPVFLQENFWGFVGFDDCRRERKYTKTEEMILRSASRMFANALMRQDIAHDLRVASIRLGSALEKAQDASRAKSDFLAKMSHEIRTPMNAIVGMTELALRCEELVSAREHIHTVKQAGMNLLSLINDILDLSKIETGKLEIYSGDYLFSSLINDIINVIRMRAADSHIRLVVNIDSKIPNSLFGDATRVRQVLINILGNAVKYTEKGFVSFTVTGEKTENGIMLNFEIKDSGIGIKAENIKDLFGEYTQFDPGRNKGIEGAGLGLAISNSIVKAMNGNIAVESEYGKGSTFTVTLPQEVRSGEPFASVKNPNEKSVLLYERREIYASSIVYNIENLGVKCIHISNDSELQREISSHDFSFVFISYELYRQNRQTISKFEKNAKIVILSEFGEAVPEKNLNILSMPVYSMSIADVLNGISDRFSYNENNELIVRFTAPDANVLIVDDINTNLKVAEGLLLPYKMKITLCKSGMEALELIKANRYDLVFMDHKMPGMDGMETTQRLRAMGEEDSYYKDLPVIALTANAVVGTKEIFLENGFNDFLSKPIDTVRMNTVLENWLPIEKQRRARTELIIT